MNCEKEDLLIDFLTLLNCYLVVITKYIDANIDKKEIFYLNVLIENIKREMLVLKPYYEFIDI